jgi:hypothetical protein
MIPRIWFARLALSLSHTRLDCTWIKIIPEDNEIRFIGKHLHMHLMMSSSVVTRAESHVLNQKVF